MRSIFGSLDPEGFTAADSQLMTIFRHLANDSIASSRSLEYLDAQRNVIKVRWRQLQMSAVNDDDDDDDADATS